jgi:hypothetical protein
VQTFACVCVNCNILVFHSTDGGNGLKPLNFVTTKVLILLRDLHI